MANSIVQELVAYFEEYPVDLLFVKNLDKFLYRDDVKAALGEVGIRIIEKKGIQLRIDFEINFKKEKQRTIYLVDELDVKEDMLQEGIELTFLFKNILPELHDKTVYHLTLKELDLLFKNKPAKNLNKKETEDFVKLTLHLSESDVKDFDLDAFEEKVNQHLEKEDIDWFGLIEEISDAIVHTIGHSDFDSVLLLIAKCNTLFQKEKNYNYQQVLTASFVKKPRIVSSILNFLSHHHLKEKVALVIIDGMTFWQYQLIRRELSKDLDIESDFTYSWIPSITQLSRQAIFKGDVPSSNYVQNPKNEEKLWRGYWSLMVLQDHEVSYSYNSWNFSNLHKISKYAAVFSGLDDKMHSSSDYIDLKSLTINWAKKSGILEGIKTLVDSGFTVYLSTDHGNVPAQGWRNLNDKEKLGTLKSGSRSARHVYYSEKWLAVDFMKSNPDLSGSVSQEDAGIYFTDLKSFSHQKELVTHGGSHLLEVIIPFCKITHGS